MSKLILPRRRLLRLAAPALILPYRRAGAQALPGPGPGTPAAPPAPPWTLVQTVNGVWPGSGSAPVTTPSISTVGANYLICVAGYLSSAVPTLSDSLSNTWITPGAEVGTYANQQWYCQTPAIVGASHTFTLDSGGVSIGQYFIVAAFKSGSGTPQWDNNLNSGRQTNSTSSNTGTLTTTAVPPGHANDLIIASCTTNGTTAIDSGMTLLPLNGLINFAWKISSVPVAPTWTVTGGGTIGITIMLQQFASF